HDVRHGCYARSSESCRRGHRRRPRLNSGVDELAGGIRRITSPLPMELDHVHCYLLPGTDGWTLVDTGFGAPGLVDRWRDLLVELSEPVARIVITHFHPHHVGGAHALQKISPTVGLYPDARPDPLGDYLASLERTIELAPRVAFPGHGDPIDDPVGRAEELLDHHRRRLDETEALLGARPWS